MGCNQSKSEDIQKSQQTRERTVPQSMPPRGTTSSAPISSSVSQSVDPNIHIGSYTDQRDMEQGQFKDIVEQSQFKDIVDRTASNFIDVSGAGLPLEKESQDRSSDFGKHTIEGYVLREIKIFTLPTASTTHAYHTVLSQPTQKSGFEHASKCSQSVHTGLKNMHVKDVGELVTTFPEISG
eukprot:TRINITY_DN237_c0_g1_i1.p1 TRINITY_DN237_c0_g1~~TRINITY_DN237_c0_g1_i1.p1  ORF type:complete len:181 (-),score=47.92 TRINITY_DN237_c0_g1_i1:61-603(-)